MPVSNCLSLDCWLSSNYSLPEILGLSTPHFVLNILYKVFISFLAFLHVWYVHYEINSLIIPSLAVKTFPSFKSPCYLIFLPVANRHFSDFLAFESCHPLPSNKLLGHFTVCLQGTWEALFVQQCLLSTLRLSFSKWIHLPGTQTINCLSISTGLSLPFKSGRGK